jgi:DNA mismatch repair protein MutS2
MEQSLGHEFDRLEAALGLWRKNPDLFTEMLGILESLKDPLHAISLLQEGQVLSPTELFILANLCACVRRIRHLQDQTGISKWPANTVPPGLEPAEVLLAPGSQGQPRFYISDAYSASLAETRRLRKHKQEMWHREMAKQARAVETALGVRISGTGEMAIRKTGRAQLEKARLMPELGETRQTLSHVYFKLKPTRDAVNLETELNLLKAKQRAQETEVLRELSGKLKQHLPVVEAASQALGELDFLLSKAELARATDATRPEIIRPGAGDGSGSGKAGLSAKHRGPGEGLSPGKGMDSGIQPEPGRNSSPGPDLILQGAFHPIVLNEVKSRGGTYQPVSIELDSIVSVITGPNMGGKTVALSTVGLCVAMAQWGLMVPCNYMKFGLYDFIYFQPGEEQTPGLSSFAAEIVSLKQPLARAGERGLVLLDEVGRGTNPSQGRALYAALLQYYLENDTAGSTVIATTHYHGLAATLGVPHWQVRGLATEALGLKDSKGPEAGEGAGWSEGSERTELAGDGLDWLYRHMDYTLQKVGPDTPTPQDALVVAKALGLDAAIIDKALKFHGRGG